MKRYRIYVAFEAEETSCQHYFEIDEIYINHFSKDGNELSVMTEVTQYIGINYPNRTVASINIRKR